MRLEKLEIRGFKSFREKTVLKFPDQFTAIVGPNGVGKSNIVEAISFVLGQTRGLRGDNMIDLICNGGTKGEALNSANVTLYLDGGNGKTAISREITRDGKSIYRLNGKRSSRQEIIDLIGENEYNIIHQEDITKLISLKPVERRQIIDDLCGIGEYDKKKEKAIRELEKVEKTISELQLILGEKEGYLKRLEEEKEEALRYQRLQQELKNYEGSEVHYKLQRDRKKLHEIQESIEELKNEKEKNSSRIQELRSGISDKNDELKKLNEEILSLEKEKGKGSIQELSGEILRKKERLQSLQANLGRIQEAIKESSKKKDELKSENKELSSRQESLENELQKLNKKIKEEAKLSGDTKLEEKIDSLKTQLFEFKSELNTLQEINSKAAKDKDTLQEESSTLKSRIGELLKKEKSLAESMDSILIKNKDDQEEFKRLKSELPRLEERYKKTQVEINSLRLSLAEKRAEIKTMEESSSGLNNAIRSIMKLKEIISGIYGPVFQLGKADQRYEGSLAIAAGNRINSIVVENEEVASKCINYLRKKKIGRSTFLPLNKIRVKVKGKPPKEAIGFARDFIQSEKRFNPIFEYVFRDTILVDNLEKAKSIGVGKWRMVTLDSDLLELSGAMTGGYLRRKESWIGFQNTERLEGEISSLEKKIVSLDKSLEELDLEKDRIQKRINELEPTVSSYETDIEKIKLEKNSLAERREELKEGLHGREERINSLEKDIKTREEQIKGINRDIEAFEKELEKLSKKRSKEDLGSLEKLKDQARDREIEKNKLMERTTFIKEQVFQLQANLKSLNKEKADNEKEIETIEKELSQLGKEIKVAEKDDKDLIEKINLLMEQQSKIEEHISREGEKIGELEYSLEKVNENINQGEIKKAKVETQLEELEEEFKRYSGIDLVDKKITEMKDGIEKITLELESFEAVNMRAIQEYDKRKEEFEETSGKLETLKNERQSIFDFMEKVEKKKRETFMETFDVVKENFENVYQELAEGDGTLSLDNPRNISETGLLIIASPKGKKKINIDSMSQGEKVLTSAAFLLAIQQYKPAHFYVVDELDAPLDKENSLQLAKMLGNSKAQFMLITHNDYMIKYAKSVIGVSMTDGLSHIVGVRLT